MSLESGQLVRDGLPHVLAQLGRRPVRAIPHRLDRDDGLRFIRRERGQRGGGATAHERALVVGGDLQPRPRRLVAQLTERLRRHRAHHGAQIRQRPQQEGDGPRFMTAAQHQRRLGAHLLGARAEQIGRRDGEVVPRPGSRREARGRQKHGERGRGHQQRASGGAGQPQ